MSIRRRLLAAGLAVTLCFASSPLPVVLAAPAASGSGGAAGTTISGGVAADKVLQNLQEIQKNYHELQQQNRTDEERRELAKKLPIAVTCGELPIQAKPLKDTYTIYAIKVEDSYTPMHQDPLAQPIVYSATVINGYTLAEVLNHLASTIAGGLESIFSAVISASTGNSIAIATLIPQLVDWETSRSLASTLLFAIPFLTNVGFLAAQHNHRETLNVTNYKSIQFKRMDEKSVQPPVQPVQAPVFGMGGSIGIPVTNGASANNPTGANAQSAPDNTGQGKSVRMVSSVPLGRYMAFQPVVVNDKEKKFLQKKYHVDFDSRFKGVLQSKTPEEQEQLKNQYLDWTLRGLITPEFPYFSDHTFFFQLFFKKGDSPVVEVKYFNPYVITTVTPDGTVETRRFTCANQQVSSTLINAIVP